MTAYTLNNDKMFVDITDGVAIVINSETGIYYGMNGLGTNVFENISKGVSVEKISDTLKNISGAPQDVEARLSTFINALKDKEIVLDGAESAEKASIDEVVAKADAFSLEVNEYSDAQEMLLADPIHEVKEDTGWTPEKDSIGYTKEETREREKKMEK